MFKINTDPRAVCAIEGPEGTGMVPRLHPRGALSGFTDELLPSAIMIDLHGRDDLGWIPLELLVSTMMAGMALLWFRRSKRNDSKRQQESNQASRDASPPESAPRQARVPLRIRGLLLLNLRPADGTEHIETAPPLGTRDAVIRAVQTAAPGIQFDDAGHGELGGSDHRITIDLGREEPVQAAVASAEGDAGIEQLRALMQSERWRAYAPRAGVFIEPDALDLFALPDSAPPQSRL